MSSPALDACLTELQAALEEKTPELDGLQLFKNLGLSAPVMEKVSAAINEYSTRHRQLQQAIQALTALKTGGYPQLNIPPVSVDLYNQIQKVVKSIDEAFAEFTTPDPAATATITSGTPATR